MRSRRIIGKRSAFQMRVGTASNEAFVARKRLENICDARHDKSQQSDLRTMSSRADRRRRQRDEQMKATMRPSEQPGMYELSVSLAGLRAPEREFYCNTATLQKRSNYAEFVFGQMAPGAPSVQNAVVIDIPYKTIRPLAATFDAKFRERLAKITHDLAPMDPYFSGAKQIQSLSFYGHLARMTLNDYAGVIDVYELTPSSGEPVAVDPVIRIKALPAVIKWFVDCCDEIVSSTAAGAEKKPEP